ncbi:F0F1 ATP synthase subunit epsilon [Primorskyibacter sp. S187A]|uniref:F0F1 ATP synthase subunit epsilon n=1 Tax=Primorskyibacter sp. S187A TaxID=3415130 RepID=UPI003C7AAF72
MQFDLVSPERSLASLEVTAVQIPGADGDMTAMADHAPTITTLRPGILKAESSNGTTEYLVTGGFAEIGAAGVTVLAERALPKADVTQDDVDAMLADAKAAVDGAAAEAADDAAKLLADMTALASEIGLKASA